jgi:asparagine synthase (glutamine-hydrolysing)
MCGIVGVYHPTTDAAVDFDLFSKMVGILEHRGPDDDGLYCEGSVALGMRRLSIIDVDGGHQPIHNENSKIWVVFNGEIYNYKELRADLESRGHVFYTQCDTEVLVHAYETWGDDSVLRLNGIFAFALWDTQPHRLLLARDHFGVKPLYYYWNGEQLIFASELKAILLHPAVPRAIDPQGLDLALAAGFIPSPYTLFQGIRKLGPGYRLNVVGDRLQVERYWRPVPVMCSRSEDEVVSELRFRLESGVRRQMVSDVPIGALLSGGVDSTAIVTLMSRHSSKVRTFSVGARDGQAANETQLARATAARLATEHAEIQVSAQEYMDFLPRAHWYLEEPSTPSALFTYFVCRLARQSVKVVLTGQGADEPFAGYARYTGETYGALYRSLPDVISRRLVPSLFNMLPLPLKLKRGAYALAENDSVRRFARMYEVYSVQDRMKLLRPEVLPSLTNQDALAQTIEGWTDRLDDLDSLEQLLYIDARMMLSDNLLNFGDKMSMAASVEARVPMLDLELMEFAESIPANLKIKHRRPKYLLKRAVADLVPAEVLQRRKRAFEVPLDVWLTGDLFAFASDWLLGPSSLSSTFLEPDVIRRTLEQHRDRRQNLWRQIYTLLSVEMLHRSLVSSPPPGNLDRTRPGIEIQTS